ncbi:DUF72 domain-containing protein [Ramlibacter henchirensis]|uniref:DUF72 domain-containing protein n=1 Tax=Ramlibacter henchirensis TaxID=204072 RepID=A0A4Z0CBP5_9BURK|nr:DUF72 domain-containing protein [Ramlibacter henchirensis]TFZ07555.1 DUF72 domain-containing protein [Ramlibacter henchirensis]
MRRPVRIGCAGWQLPLAVQAAFPPGDSHLRRYSAVFGASEINSSFHRPHRRSTYERWADSVPEGFAFSVKVPKAITHERRLVDCDALLREFFGQCAGLGDRMRCVLVQLPPSLAFDAAVADGFFSALADCFGGTVALEPRHGSWFNAEVDEWLAERRVSRVLADPVRHDAGRRPGGWTQLVYLRLHGSPRTYYSSYADDVLRPLADRITLEVQAGREVWCIFDNTAGQAAAGDALRLRGFLGQT